jgi:hypothetical protein
MLTTKPEVQYMRSRLTATLIALLAVSAFGAVASGSASAALPEFLNKEGNAPVLKGLKVTGATIHLVTKGATRSCTGLEGREAKITGAKTVSLIVVFKGCFEGTEKCHQEGEPVGTVVTGVLKGTLYYEAAKEVVGMYFEPEAAKGSHNGTLANFDCGATDPLTGCLPTVVSAHAVNKLVSSFGDNFYSEREAETEEKTKFNCHLEFSSQKAALEGDPEWTPEELIEVKV